MPTTWTVDEPTVTFPRITEAGDTRITEDGEIRAWDDDGDFWVVVVPP